MTLDKEYLLALKQKAEAERARLLQHMHEANGAIGMLDVLIQRLEQPAPPAQPPQQ